MTPPCFFCGLTGTREAPRWGIAWVVVHGVRRLFCGLCWDDYMKGHGRG